MVEVKLVIRELSNGKLDVNYQLNGDLNGTSKEQFIKSVLIDTITENLTKYSEAKK